MTDRIQKLRELSLNAVNRLSAERALLVTQFYKNEEAKYLPTPVQRAMAFKYIMENKAIFIQTGELIVGERGPKPKATPTYPEVCLHSIDDLKIINSRPKVSFLVDDETFKVYNDIIIPFWKGKTQRDKVFASLPKQWHNAYYAGVFTEFQEQRAPGHTVAGKKLFQRGMNDVKGEIEAAMNSLNKSDLDYSARIEQLKAMTISSDAIVLFANRYADLFENIADTEKKYGI